MPQKTISKLIVIFIAMLVLAPLFTSAALQLEYRYPDLPGAQTVTSKSPLGDVIHYYVNAAVLLAILISIVSVIIAGVQYLTSTGRPEAMREAKSRISNSFLGLAILVCSYLILVTINPQLFLMRIYRVPMESGILLFDETGYHNFVGDQTATIPQLSIDQIIDFGRARYLNYDIPDTKAEFGQLVVVSPQGAAKTKVNFADFPLYAIGFWGKEDSFARQVKIINYSEVFFSNVNLGKGKPDEIFPIEYTFEGKLKEVEEPPGSGNFKKVIDKPSKEEGQDYKIFMIVLDNDFFESTNVKYVNRPIAEYNNQTEEDKRNITKNPLTPPSAPILHPPLSIRIQPTGPGVFLYSDEKGQRYFQTSHDNFERSDVNFDNKAKNISLVNRNKQGEKIYDYLAVLHSEPYYKGEPAMFFEERGYPHNFGEEVPALDNIYPKIYLEADYYTKDDLDLTDAKWASFINNNSTPADTSDDKFTTYSGKELETKIGRAIGNIGEPDLKYPVDRTQGHGAIDINDASSIQIFEIDEKATNKCKEVRLCGRKGGLGYCVSFTPGGVRKKGVYDSITLPIPFYLPASIPKFLKGVVMSKNDVTQEDELKVIEIGSRQVKSIYIDGSCLVGLFEHRVKDPMANTAKEMWDKEWPGTHSEIFTESDLDLTNNPIGLCGGGLGKLQPGEGKPCASAIVVFPLKGD